MASTFHLQALKTSEDYHRLPENFRKPFFHYIGRSLKILGCPTLSSTLNDNIMHVLQCYIVYYALLCFNDLTGDVCIGMLTERLWMVHIRQHADVFLQMEIASAVRAAFYIDCRMLSCTHWFCICRSLANRYNLFKKSRVLPKPITANLLCFQPIRGNIALRAFCRPWGWLHVFPRLAVVGTKATVFALLFLIRIRFHSWEVGSTFEQCRSKIKLCYSWLCWW